MNLRQLFLSHVAQTSEAPMALEIVKARGCTLTDANGKEYLDLIGGISVANTGHSHPAVTEAIKTQVDAYLHVMVYGEFIQAPQVQYAQLLVDHLPSTLNSVYFTNSGAEAVEGAMKLAKRVTGRTNIISFNKSYHGSTQGALSLIGDEYWRNAYRPLLPGILHLEYNSFDDLQFIDESVACVIMETVQAESGIKPPNPEWIKEVEQRCREKGALFILDEIQCGFGRTGKLWGFQNFDVIPDVLLLGKALGGGLPLGAFISSNERMRLLSKEPVLGHITTFGGHPLSCTAGMASMKVLLAEGWIEQVSEKERKMKEKLREAGLLFRSYGLWMAVDFESPETCLAAVHYLLKNGLLTDWFLFAPQCIRIAPPLSITEEELSFAAELIIKAKGPE